MGHATRRAEPRQVTNRQVNKRRAAGVRNVANAVVQLKRDRVQYGDSPLTIGIWLIVFCQCLTRIMQAPGADEIPEPQQS